MSTANMTSDGTTQRTKLCATCTSVKAVDQFYVHPNGTLYKRCKTCHYMRTQIWRSENIAKIRSLERARYAAGGRDRKRAEKRLRKYGITPEQYGALLEAQDHVCPICTLPFVESIYTPGQGQGAGSWELPSVDHDHDTGKVRGILHRRCNLVLEFGLTADDMRRAEQYLADHGGRP